MMTILKIDSSITGEASVSRQLTAATLDQLVAQNPGSKVIVRDLAADTVVIGAPMYNFGVPSQLKAWIDRIAVAGKTFRYGADGRPEGLVGNKRVIVAISRGGFYDDSNALEHVETYLRGLFGFIGITPSFVHADGIAVGPEQRDAGIAKGLAEVVALAA